jgi:hypothetical protein
MRQLLSVQRLSLDVCTTQYAGKENEGLEAAIDAQISEFIGLIERKYLSTDAEFRPIDLAM